jgi:phenylacetic acid degradation operon negative regulatory protein
MTAVWTAAGPLRRYMCQTTDERLPSDTEFDHVPALGRCAMKPRAVVWDLFGDHLRYVGDGRIPMQALNPLLEVFGVGDSTARVVLARMRREHWFETYRNGRQSSYALTPRGAAVLDEGRARIFERGTSDWDGLWRMVIYGLPEQNRSQRDQLRKLLAWHGFGPLASATWISPHPRLDRIAEALREQSAGRLDLLESRALDRTADREMAARCWDLESLARDYYELLAQYEELPPPSELAALPGDEALRKQVSLVSSYRRLPFRDPDLPDELLPEGWPGHRVHELFTAAHDALHGPADRFVRDVIDRSYA